MSTRECHWILTLTWATGPSSYGTWSSEGTITVANETRQEILYLLIAHGRKTHPAIAENVAIQFFALEPNELAVSSEPA